MVFNVQRVPAPARKPILPVGKSLLHLHQIERAADHVRLEAVGLHVGEGDHLVEHLVRPLGHVAQGGGGVGHGALAHNEAVVLTQNVVLELFEIIMGRRTVGVVPQTVCHRDLRIGVGQARCLGDESDHVFAEAVDAHVQPETQDALDLVAHLWVIHVQVRLFFGKQVQVVFVEIGVILPGFTLKDRGPVVRRQAFAAAAALAGPPVIIIMVGIVAALAALDEPGVLVRGVVDHQVHEHAHAAVVRFLEHTLEHREIAEVRVDVHIVGDVVAPVGVGRGVEGREPYRVHTQALDVVEPVQHAVEVADAVPVAVAEAPGPDVVDHHILVPGSKRHAFPLLTESFYKAAARTQKNDINEKQVLYTYFTTDTSNCNKTRKFFYADHGTNLPHTASYKQKGTNSQAGIMLTKGGFCAMIFTA